MFAIAVSSDAIASEVKMAAAAHLRRSAGKPSIAASPSAEIVSVDIRKKPSKQAGCSTDAGQPAARPMHAAYAIRLDILRIQENEQVRSGKHCLLVALKPSPPGQALRKC
jgi:hypothetical protein